MAEVIYHAIYVYVAERNKYLRTGHPRLTEAEAAGTEAACRRGAVIVSGTLEELPATLTPEEVSRRTGRAVPGAKPIATD